MRQLHGSRRMSVAAAERPHASLLPAPPDQRPMQVINACERKSRPPGKPRWCGSAPQQIAHHLLAYTARASEHCHQPATPLLKLAPASKVGRPIAGILPCSIQQCCQGRRLPAQSTSFLSAGLPAIKPQLASTRACTAISLQRSWLALPACTSSCNPSVAPCGCRTDPRCCSCESRLLGRGLKHRPPTGEGPFLAS